MNHPKQQMVLPAGEFDLKEAVSPRQVERALQECFEVFPSPAGGHLWVVDW